MVNIVKSPSCRAMFPHIWKVDTFNPQKSVYSITCGLRFDQYQKYIANIQEFLGAHSVNEDNEKFVSFDGNKLYRKTPKNNGNSSGFYLVKSQMKDELILDDGTKKVQKPFIVNIKGEDIPRDTDLAGCFLSVHSKPTVYRKVSVISNILKGVVVFKHKEAEIISDIQSPLEDGREHSVI